MPRYAGFYVFLLVVVAVVPTTIISSRSQAVPLEDQAIPSQGSDTAKKTKPRQEEPTEVTEGNLTENQKKHSRLFEIPGQVKLKDRAPEESSTDVGEDIPLRIARYANADEYLNALVCASDAIVQGTIKSKSSQLTELGTNIFTDYELIIENVLKGSDLPTPIQLNSNITVTREGGTVKLNGRILRVAHTSQPALKVNKDYILFLKRVPATGAYTPMGISGESSFQIEGDKLTQVSEEPMPMGASGTAETPAFLNQIRTAVNAPCKH
ncbi:MAG TPA: hypothetical protein VGQ39_11990 [Pyrinomonadaceae bacterium]|nr:hypothetical protein [Pyrinomonadaceae bacterium]